MGGIWNNPGPGMGTPALGIIGGGMKGSPPGNAPGVMGDMPGSGTKGGGFCPMKGGMFGCGGMGTPPMGKAGMGIPLGGIIGVPLPVIGMGMGGCPGTKIGALGRGAPPTVPNTSSDSKADWRRAGIRRQKQIGAIIKDIGD